MKMLAIALDLMRENLFFPVSYYRIGLLEKHVWLVGIDSSDFGSFPWYLTHQYAKKILFHPPDRYNYLQ